MEDIEHKQPLSDSGIRGGAGNCLSNLKDSSIFKRYLIESSHPLRISKPFPLSLTIRGTSLIMLSVGLSSLIPLSPKGHHMHIPCASTVKQTIVYGKVPLCCNQSFIFTERQKKGGMERKWEEYDGQVHLTSRERPVH